MTDFLLLTKEEVREAREGDRKYMCKRFLHYKPDNFGCVAKQSLSPICRFCKVLTEFASQGDPKGKGGEDDVSK